MFIIGLAFGSVANAISGFVGNSQAMKEFIARMGGTTLVDAYLGTALFMMAIIAAFYGIQSVQGLHSEETLLHAEQLLTTPASRPAWVASHVAVALSGSVLVLLAAGLGAAMPYAILTHDAGQVPRIVGAMLIYLPAVWLLVGFTVALFGLLPQAMGAAWAAMAAFFVVGFFGELLKMPAWVNDLSPFSRHPTCRPPPSASFRWRSSSRLTSHSWPLACQPSVAGMSDRGRRGAHLNGQRPAGRRFQRPRSPRRRVRPRPRAQATETLMYLRAWPQDVTVSSP